MGTMMVLPIAAVNLVSDLWLMTAAVSRNRVCSGCKLRKPLTDFYRKGAGHRRNCKSCHNIVCARYYAKNGRRVRAHVGKKRAMIRDYLRAVKTASGCADCKKKHPYWRLDFDHRNPATKSIDVSRISSRVWGIARIEQELSKCDVVCANCHRDREQRRLTGRRAA